MSQMIKPEQIPLQVVHTFSKANNGCECDVCTSVALAAAINAWPNACRIEFDDWVEMVEGEIVLPAPLEGK